MLWVFHVPFVWTANNPHENNLFYNNIKDNFAHKISYSVKRRRRFAEYATWIINRETHLLNIWPSCSNPD